MRQMITRMDDSLHAQLKRRAARERRSVNSLVTEILEEAVAEDGGGAALVARLSREIGRVIPPAPARVPSRDEAIASTRGMGSAASEALEAERAAR